MNSNDLACKVQDRERVRETFSRCGVVVVRGGIEKSLVTDMHATLLSLIRARLLSLGHALNSGNLDEAYLQLKGIQDGLSRNLIVAARETMDFYNIIASRLLGEQLKQVIPSGVLQVVHDCCMMRIDGREDDRNFDWHYDFAFNAMSEHAITCWIPITKVTPDMGCMSVLVGSHTTVRPVRLMHDLAGVAFAGPRKIQLAENDTEAFERDAVQLPSVEPGDVILLHALTLHRSGENVTDRARWIVNPRFSDLLDNEVVSRGWKVSRAKDPFVFAEIRPDHVLE